MWNKLLDSTIFFSFDRSGFLRHQKDFKHEERTVQGQNFLITGANSGIGYSLAMSLAEKGANLWLLCRNPEKAAKAKLQIVEKSGNDKVSVVITDLSSFSSILKSAESLKDIRIDALIHNAGVLPNERVQTEDGLELTCATNLVGPYLLTKKLEKGLKRSEDPRMIFVSSGGMYPIKLNSKILFNPKEPFDGVKAYAMTKRAQVILAEILNEDLKTVSVHSMHPGWAETPGVQTSIPGFYEKMKQRLRSPKEGADTILYLLLRPRLEKGGLFWFDRKPRKTHFFPWTRESQKERAKMMEMLNSATAIIGKPESDK